MAKVGQKRTDVSIDWLRKLNLNDTNVNLVSSIIIIFFFCYYLLVKLFLRIIHISIYDTIWWIFLFCLFFICMCLFDYNHILFKRWGLYLVFFFNFKFKICFVLFLKQVQIWIDLYMGRYMSNKLNKHHYLYVCISITLERYSVIFLLIELFYIINK